MRKLEVGRAAILSVAVTLASGPAMAHTLGAQGGGFVAGLGHPLLGLDHLLTMVAVGLWAFQLGGRAVWLVPTAFVTALAAGAGLALLGVHFPAVEPGIVASVLILGLLVAGAVRLPTAVGMAVVGLFALFHGHAHGAEMPEAAHPALYGLGFILATVALHATGVALGVATARLAAPAAARIAGAAVALAGLWAMIAPA